MKHGLTETDQAVMRRLLSEGHDIAEIARALQAPVEVVLRFAPKDQAKPEVKAEPVIEQDAEQETDNEQEPVKRGRGRPPKSAVADTGYTPVNPWEDEDEPA
jgi:hypothetical protein